MVTSNLYRTAKFMKILLVSKLTRGRYKEVLIKDLVVSNQLLATITLLKRMIIFQLISKIQIPCK